MSQLELTFTEGVDPQQAQRLATELRRHLAVDGPHPVLRRADPSTISQFIQLLGSHDAWLLLLPASWFFKPYLATLGPIAAQATRDGLAALFKKKEVKPLAEVATALADVKKARTGHVELFVGLDIPDPQFGTALRITSDSAEEIARAVAAFVTHAEKLSTLMMEEVAANRAPLSGAHILLKADGSLTVQWLSRDFANHEKRIE
jgi:hypothetical protein